MWNDGPVKPSVVCVWKVFGPQGPTTGSPSGGTGWTAGLQAAHSGAKAARPVGGPVSG